MAKKSSSITIQDVARLAGVSPASVSKVFNNKPGVAKETVRRVKEAANQLDFRPNILARSLRVKKTHTLGLITDDIEGVFTTSLVRGVEDVSAAQGFSVFLCNSYGDPQKEQAHIEVLLDKQVDGFILLSGYRVRERGAPAAPVGNLPLVYLYQYTRELPAPAVVPDDRGGGRLGTEHLLSLGHLRIGLINGPERYEATRLRCEGYREALEAAGVAYDPALVCSGEWNQKSAYELTHALMELEDPPTAIFCTSDILAIGIADALQERRLRIPQDVALVSFDNRFFAANQRPPLTDVALPLYEMGKKAGELLIEAVRTGQLEDRIIKMPCYLVVRESSGAN